MYHPGGERRRLFGAGEGPAEAVAGAKQDAWNGSTQAGVRNKMRNNDLRLGYGHRHKSLFDKHKPFLHKDLQRVMSD